MLKEQEINLVELIDRYHSEDSCRARMEELRWPEGVECPRCDSKSIARMEPPPVPMPLMPLPV